MMCIGHWTCLFHFVSDDCMVEFIDTNVHAVLGPAHSFLIELSSQIYPSFLFLSREVLSHCSSTN
jgi:hypothetical protein